MANNSVRIHPLVYYQKPQVGGVNANEKNISPVQIIFPNGGFGLGIPVKDDLENGTSERVNNIIFRIYNARMYFILNDILNKSLTQQFFSRKATTRLLPVDLSNLQQMYYTRTD